MHATQADAVAIIVFNGKLGSGFEVHTVAGVDPNAIADALESMIAHIRAEQTAIHKMMAETGRGH